MRGLDRFLAALATSLWHEFAIVLGGLAILALVWGAPTFALWTYGVLVLMNLSARLDLFLGVRNLTPSSARPSRLPRLLPVQQADEPAVPGLGQPGHDGHRMIGRAALVGDPWPRPVGFTMLATLMGLATLEHWFLMLPLPLRRPVAVEPAGTRDRHHRYRGTGRKD